MSFRLLIRILIYVLGVVFFAWCSYKSYIVTFDGETATAKCVGVHYEGSGEGRRWVRVLEFYEEDWTKKTVKISRGLFWMNPEEGESVTIRYSRKNPEIVFYDSFLHIWFIPTVIAAFLIGLFVFQRLRISKSTRMNRREHLLP